MPTTKSTLPDRRARALLTATIAGLILAGCGGGSGTPTVASLPGHTGSASPVSMHLTVAQSDRDMVAFARCMRRHGVQMSDPFHRPGHSGLSIDLPTQDAATAAAYRVCDEFIRPIVQSKQAAATPDPPPVLAALSRYARCMRSHDIPMLDPTATGAVNLGHVPAITSDFGRYSPQFRTADGACRSALPSSVHDNGTGP